MKKVCEFTGSLWIVFSLLCSASFAEPPRASIEDPNHEGSGVVTLGDLNNDVLRLISQMSEIGDHSRLNRTCKYMQALTVQELAAKQIKALIGDFVVVKAGAYRDTAGVIREFKEDRIVPVDDVLQSQYDLTAGQRKAAAAMAKDPGEENLAGPKKPMGGVKYADWDKHIEKVNEELTRLWPIAYPGTKVRQAYRGEVHEYEYLMTEPVEDGEEVVLEDGRTVKITGKLTEHSGTDSQDEKEVKDYVVFGKKWNDGPSDVDTTNPNQRGLRNMTGNIYKQTSTPIFGSDRVMLGGNWDFDRRSCRSASRNLVHPEYPYQFVGLRLLLK